MIYHGTLLRTAFTEYIDICVKQALFQTKTCTLGRNSTFMYRHTYLKQINYRMECKLKCIKPQNICMGYTIWNVMWIVWTAINAHIPNVCRYYATNIVCNSLTLPTGRQRMRTLNADSCIVASTVTKHILYCAVCHTGWANPVQHVLLKPTRSLFCCNRSYWIINHHLLDVNIYSASSLYRWRWRSTDFGVLTSWWNNEYSAKCPGCLILWYEYFTWVLIPQS